jgi:hypothetical protein
MLYFRLALTTIVTATTIIIALLVADAFILAPTYTAFDCIRAIDPFAATMAVGVSAQRVIRVFKLPEYLGVRKSQIAEMIKAGLLHPFPPFPGARSMVVTEAEVAALQEQGKAEAAEKAAAGQKRGIELNRKAKLARETAASEESPYAKAQKK